MKKFLKWSAIVGVSIILFLWGWLELESYFSNKNTFTRIVTVDGDSMSPTLHDGDKILVDTRKKPEPGDIVTFYCNAEKCRNNPEHSEKFIKRLVRSNNGCYWFEGDNAQNSFDSRLYGLLCDAEIILDGVMLSVESKASAIIEPVTTTLVPLNDSQPEIESVAEEEAVLSAPSPQPVAVKAQPKEEKKKKDNFDKELREISEMLNQPSKLSEKSDLPKLEPTTISKPSTYKSPDFHVDVKYPTTSSGSKLTGAECGGSAGKHLPYCPK